MDTNFRWPSQELSILSGKGKDTEEKQTAPKHWMSIFWYGWIFQECLPSVSPFTKGESCACTRDFEMGVCYLCIVAGNFPILSHLFPGN